MPGQPWVPIREREKRRRRQLHALIVTTTVAAVLLVSALWTLAQEWLGADSRIVATFVAAAAGVVALLAAVAEILGYLQGTRKRQPR